MSMPVVPPRPARAHGASGPADAATAAARHRVPQIPRRPIRKADLSPDRDAYTRSPLNFPPAAGGNGWPRPPAAASKSSAESASTPSIVLPEEVGQEGVEYTSYEQLPPDAHGSAAQDVDERRSGRAPTETKNVSADVPLQQPRASHPQSTTTSRIATVTRTDSTQAAAAGIGRPASDDGTQETPSDSSASLSRVTSTASDDHDHHHHQHRHGHHSRTASGARRSSSGLAHGASGGTPRPASLHGHDHHQGIPEIGMQIPLYPHAGDVQAPSPAPTLPQHASGIGFFNDGSARAHHRKRSSRHEFGPPGSYGLHGHGTQPHDQFEKEWIAKHPDTAKKENSPYLHRPATALSSDQLNQIVSESPPAPSVGTAAEPAGQPTDDIAFEAADQYTSRMNSPRPTSAAPAEPKKRASSGYHSPLRRRSLQSRETARHAADSDDEDVIHIDPPRHGSRAGEADETADSDQADDASGWAADRRDSAPILAADELIKRPGSAFLQPAVEPDDTHPIDDTYYESDHLPPSGRSSQRPPSRPPSRPVGAALTHIEEYEPLFPEGEDHEHPPKKTLPSRPNLAHHHFPSQDVWEDVPESLTHQTIVQTPEPPPPSQETTDGSPARAFETPEQEQQRRSANTADLTSNNKTLVKPHFKPGVHHDVHAERPGVPRFPSRDIWEDTPDSMRLVTTVDEPPRDETQTPPEDRPAGAASVSPPSSREGAEVGHASGAAHGATRPHIPARPERRSKLAQEVKPEEPPQQRDAAAAEKGAAPDAEHLLDRTKPVVPGRPKPTVPVRPPRHSHSDQADGAGAPLTKTSSATSAGSGKTGSSSETITPPPPQPALKAKPAVPARPAGNKIAALQAGFMSDLNKRLKLGPQGPPPKAKEAEGDGVEPAAETEKKPLADARKGRAKGPPRRKPASAAAAAAPDNTAADAGFALFTPATVWQIDEDDMLNVPSATNVPSDTDVPSTTLSASEPAAELKKVPSATDTSSVEESTAELEKALSANEESNTREPTMLIKSASMSSDKPEKPTSGGLGSEGEQLPATVHEAAVDEEEEAVQPELEKAPSQAKAVPAPAEPTEQDVEKETTATAADHESADATLSVDGPAKTAVPLSDQAHAEGDGPVKDGE